LAASGDGAEECNEARRQKAPTRRLIPLTPKEVTLPGAAPSPVGMRLNVQEFLLQTLALRGKDFIGDTWILHRGEDE
jgi:hypothetical protein